MAGEEVEASEQAKAILRGKAMVETWASIVDVALQEYLNAGLANDRIRAAIAAVKLAQIGLMLENYFKPTAEDLLESETELNAARRAVALTAAMVKDRVNASLGFSSEQASVEVDPSLN